MWYIWRMWYYLAIERNGPLVYITTQIDLRTSHRVKEARRKRRHMISSTLNSRICKWIYSDRKQLSVSLKMENSEKLEGKIKKEYKQALQIMDMFIVLILKFLHLWYTRHNLINLYTLNVCSLFYQLCLNKDVFKAPKQNHMLFLKYKNIT